MILPNNPFSFVEETLETILPSPIPPWGTPVLEVKNLGKDRTDVIDLISTQINIEQQLNALVIFTIG